MRILVTENQMKKYSEKLNNMVQKYGFFESVNKSGLSRLRLAELAELPVMGDTFHDANEVLVGHLLEDLVKRYNHFRNCKLKYEEGHLEWYCDFELNEESGLKTRGFSTPYFSNNNSTIVYLNDVTLVPSYKTYKGDNILLDFQSPEFFESTSDLIEWFTNDYMEKTYQIILNEVERLTGYQF